MQGTVKGRRKQGRQRKRWEDNIREWTGLEFAKSQRAVENREKWRKLVASVVPQRLSRLRDRWERWWDQNLIFGVSLIKREDPPTQLSRTWPSCYTLVWHPHAEFRREGSFLSSVWHPHAECRREDSALGSKIRLTPQSFRFDQDVALCWLVECTMIRVSFQHWNECTLRPVIWLQVIFLVWFMSLA